MIPPVKKPNNINFSSGPCSKRPGWTLENLKNSLVGRSHRSKECLERITELLNQTRKILDLPKDYRLAIMPASDTGAMESAIWNLLGLHTVDVISFEEFGYHWLYDIKEELKIKHNPLTADYGLTPDLSTLDQDNNDLLFVLNGTTSGVCFNDLSFINDNRKRLTICDATSAIFAIPIDFTKLDVITYSWQKTLGGEAQHGILILSPLAIERLNQYQPNRPIPKILRLKDKKGDLNYGIFDGMTINTPSMLCIEDCLDSLNWITSLGGQDKVHKIVNKNYTVVNNFINESKLFKNLCHDERYHSKTSVCFKISDPWFNSSNKTKQKDILRQISQLCESNKIGYEILNHKAAPPSFRIWCGPTIKSDDLEKLCPWIEYLYNKVKYDQK